MKYHKQAFEIDKQIGYLQGEAADLSNIGLVYCAMGKLGQAEKYQKQAEEICNSVR